MISKNQIKYIKSLEQKKVRYREGMFVAEGPKVVGDLLEAGYVPDRIMATPEWFQNGNWQEEGCSQIVTDEELNRISFLQHPQQVLAVFPIPVFQNQNHDFSSHLFLALDNVQDPGNLGTIIRIADWFGITTIFCSPDTADAYNPKVVQATMGSIARVHVVYTDLQMLFSEIPAGTPVYGTFLDGKDIYEQTLSPNGIIIMGNEGNGISHDVAKYVNKKLLIPHYPAEKETADSLNVAIATAITCAEFRRRMASL